VVHADISMLPSQYERFPNLVREALQLGKAINCTLVDGIRSALILDCNGFLVPLGNPDALKEAMWRFVSDRRRKTEYGLESRQKDQANHDLRENIKMLFVVLWDQIDEASIAGSFKWRDRTGCASCT